MNPLVQGKFDNPQLAQHQLSTVGAGFWIKDVPRPNQSSQDGPLRSDHSKKNAYIIGKKEFDVKERRA